MKKIFAYAAPLAMAMSVNLAVPTVASANDSSAKDIAELCRTYVFENDTGRVGECMKLYRSNDVVSQCTLWAIIAKETGLDFLFPFKNQGQCVKNGGPFG